MNNLRPAAFIEEINYTVEEYIDKNFQRVTAADCGLDPRAAYDLFVNKGALACYRHSVGRLDYYGGFEYIDKESRVEIGDYVFFLEDGGDERVIDAINAAINKLDQAA